MSTNYSVLLSLQTWVDLVIYILQTRYNRSDCVAYKVRIQKVIMIFFPFYPCLYWIIYSKRASCHGDHVKTLWKDLCGEETKDSC